jgi:hypothetical protein
MTRARLAAQRFGSQNSYPAFQRLTLHATSILSGSYGEIATLGFRRGKGELEAVAEQF